MRHFVVAGTCKQNQFGIAISVPKVGDNRTHQNRIANGGGIEQSDSRRPRREVTLFA
jgi:hypothetical protein